MDEEAPRQLKLHRSSKLFTPLAMVVDYVVMKAPGSNAPVVRPLRISFEGAASSQTLEFTTAFRIGRDAGCEVYIPNTFVSRVHAQVTPDDSGWSIQDLNSSNGLFLQGARVEGARIISNEVFRLGVEGPELVFQLQPEPPPLVVRSSTFAIDPGATDDEIVKRYADRYFGQPGEDQQVGEHTMFVRRAFSQVQTKQQKIVKRQKGVYAAVIAVLLVVAIGISTYTYRLHKEALRQREIAHNLFYAMKSLDMEIAEGERASLASGSPHAAETVNRYESRRKDMQANYDQFLATLHVYDAKSTEQHRLILRIARVFGECELDMPPEFEQEIMKYIKYWQSSGRYAHDIRLARDKGYTRTIPQTFLDRGLPVQFFYLGMQESDFNPYATGPITRKGYAKGMWQFIPETGVKYGLHLGPLVDLGRPDPSDERDQPEKATDAASRYISMLYSTDAQASGLLVMACYNWGEGSVLPLVQSLPPNPRERNFWALLAKHRDQIPQQTYDYVFYITSAAVIGENPRLFGFDFDNPLE